MSGDCCNTITGTVLIQENGIIRDGSGYIIGRLSKDIEFTSLSNYQTQFGETKDWILTARKHVDAHIQG